MRFILATVAVAFTAIGCIVYDNDYNPPPPPPDPYGSIAFDWSFGGVTSCAEANVDDVNVIISDATTGEVVLELISEPCIGGGLEFTDILNGVYDVVIRAFDHNGLQIYEGGFAINVDGGVVNNAGLVTLDPVGGPPPGGEGSLGFFWSFLYPTNNNVVTDCALAGVDNVDVFVTPEGANGEQFSETSICDDDHQGLNIDNLNEGRYTIRLQAHGSFGPDDVLLYDSGDVIADVFAGQTLDLGDILMNRTDSFSDFDVSWVFGDAACADGATLVTLEFQRAGFTGPEDALDVDAAASEVVRRTFVPATYTVTGTTNGVITCSASVPVDLAPASIADVSLSLTP